MKRLFSGITFILLMLALSHAPEAKVTGECSNCHTMHYSQGGTALSIWGQIGPYNSLTTNDCVGCHTAPSGQNTGSGTPYVHTVQEPTYLATGTEATTNTLAGGSFHWMKNSNKNTGHDVDGIATAFDMEPPGYPGDTYGRASTWPGSQKVTCAGSYGCHGRTDTTDLFAATKGGHHGDDSTTDGSSLAKSYRLLNGVAGKEDSDWEYQPATTAHNQYKAIHRAFGDQTSSDSTTTSYLCGQCHGEFHGGSGNIGSSSPWVRHPTDVQLPGSGEYADYNTNNTYSLITPVGSVDVSSVLSSVNPGTTDCIAICMSCHRAHGTPHYKLMRWDYMSSTLSTALSGCNVCHTSKS